MGVTSIFAYPARNSCAQIGAAAYRTALAINRPVINMLLEYLLWRLGRSVFAWSHHSLYIQPF